ncbi:MAG TPA: four helix bundle protein [Thermoanaerobaculia bacterium]
MQRFSDLRVWRRSHSLVLEVYKLTRQLPAEERFGLVSQIRRAAISVTSNIAEGSKRSHAADYAQFLCIAQGSLAETHNLVLVCRDLSFLSPSRADPLIREIEEIGRMLTELRKAVLRPR